MNVRSAINAGDDALGKFYETFLKYANGAKEMGIVLTPRHVTQFAVDVLGVGPKDRIFDPACGTGGFLISAMDAVRRKVPKSYEGFRNDGLFGIEQRDDVYGLAIVNMIFRGDGKSRVYDGNCFDHEFWLRDGQVFYTLPSDQRPDGAIRPFSRVLMNPPFKLKSNKETAFVDYGLRQMRPGGLLFAVLPAVVMTGKNYEDWRRELLKRHTLIGSIKFDKSLFYPVAEATYALIVKGHRPHKPNAQVFMGCLFDDKHRPRRSKMLSDHEAIDNLEKMTNAVHRFILGQPVKENVTREQCVTTVNFDLSCDFSPEGYLSSGTARVEAAFRSIGVDAAKRRAALKSTNVLNTYRMQSFPLQMFIEQEVEAPLKTIKEYPRGHVPVVSATAQDNGVAEWLDIPESLCLENCITISILHNTKPCEAFWHPYRFSALVGKALVLRPIEELLAQPEAILYLCESITSNNAWRYHYARSVRLHEIEVSVPVKNDNQPDIQMMADIVRGQLS